MSDSAGGMQIDALLQCGVIPPLCKVPGLGVGVVHRQEPSLRVRSLPGGRLLHPAQEMDVPEEGIAHLAAGGCRRRDNDGLADPSQVSSAPSVYQTAQKRQPAA
jgi:hypothetical protein